MNFRKPVSNYDTQTRSFYPLLRIKALKGVVALTVATGFLFSPRMVLSVHAHTDKEIVRAIFLAEGGEKAQYPYGIRSVSCSTQDECRQICLNTIRNNRKRYAKYGYKDYSTYLEFLASRYAPIGAGNDPKNLNKNWLNNVRYFLTRGEK